MNTFSYATILYTTIAKTMTRKNLISTGIFYLAVSNSGPYMYILPI